MLVIINEFTVHYRACFSSWSLWVLIDRLAGFV